MTGIVTGVGLILAQTPAPEVTLTAAGAAMMGLSVGLVLALSAFCIYRITRETLPSEHLHTPLDIDTHDAE